MNYFFSTIRLGTIWKRYVELGKYLWIGTFFFFCKVVTAGAQKKTKKVKNKTKALGKVKCLNSFFSFKWFFRHSKKLPFERDINCLPTPPPQRKKYSTTVSKMLKIPFIYTQPFPMVKRLNLLVFSMP